MARGSIFEVYTTVLLLNISGELMLCINFVLVVDFDTQSRVVESVVLVLDNLGNSFHFT